jgi:hypothetical protein
MNRSVVGTKLCKTNHTSWGAEIRSAQQPGFPYRVHAILNQLSCRNPRTVYVPATLKAALHLLLGRPPNSTFHINGWNFAFLNNPHECYVYPHLAPPRTNVYFIPSKCTILKVLAQHQEHNCSLVYVFSHRFWLLVCLLRAPRDGVWAHGHCITVSLINCKLTVIQWPCAQTPSRGARNKHTGNQNLWLKT